MDEFDKSLNALEGLMSIGYSVGIGGAYVIGVPDEVIIGTAFVLPIIYGCSKLVTALK